MKIMAASKKIFKQLLMTAKTLPWLKRVIRQLKYLRCLWRTEQHCCDGCLDGHYFGSDYRTDGL